MIYNSSQSISICNKVVVQHFDGVIISMRTVQFDCLAGAIYFLNKKVSIFISLDLAM